MGARRSALLLLKYARERNVWQRFVAWLPEWHVVLAGPRGRLLFQAMWSYLRRTSRDDPPMEVFVAIEVTLGSELREEAEGWGTRRERLAREAGRDEGREEGAIGVLLTLLAARFGPLTAETEERVRQASSAERERWAIRLLDAPDLAAVFAPS